MKNKLRRAKQQLLWESYLKLKMIEDNHNELLKLLKVCQVIEKLRKCELNYCELNLNIGLFKYLFITPFYFIFFCVNNNDYFIVNTFHCL